MVKRSTVAYQLKKEEVFQEIASILGVPKADTHTDKWFETRTIAIQRVMQRMTPAENRQLDEEVQKIEREGYSPDQKQVYVLAILTGFLC